MTDQADQSSAPIWHPRTVRGVPLHVVVPAAAAVLGFVALASGGLLAWLGGWLLTLAFPLAVGAFVRGPWALAAPAAAWALWLVLSRAVGGGLAQTPLLVAVLLAGLGVAAAWLGQRAIQPAVAGESRARHPRERLIDELEALLEHPIDPAASPSLDPSAEVDEALAELLETEIMDAEPDEAELDPAVAGGSSGGQEPQPTVEAEGSDAELGLTEDDDPTGHVIEFTALSEPDDRS